MPRPAPSGQPQHLDRNDGANQTAGRRQDKSAHRVGAAERQATYVANLRALGRQEPLEPFLPDSNGQTANAVAKEHRISPMVHVTEPEAGTELAYSVKQAADMLSVKRDTVYELINSKQLGSFKPCSRRLIARKQLEVFVESKLNQWT